MESAETCFLIGGLILDTLIILGLLLGPFRYLAKQGYPSFDKIPRSIKSMLLGAVVLSAGDVSYGYYRFKTFSKEARFQLDQMQNSLLDEQNRLEHSYAESMQHLSINLERLTLLKKNNEDLLLQLKKANQLVEKLLANGTTDPQLQKKLAQANEQEQTLINQIQQIEELIQNLQAKGEKHSISQEDVSSQITEFLKQSTKLKSQIPK